MKRQLSVRQYFKPDIHLPSKHVSLSSTMQGTPLKSPHELHIEKSNQNSSFQKATFRFFHTIYSAMYFPFPSYLLRITISEKIYGHGTMPIREQCVSRVTPQTELDEAPVPSPPFNVKKVYSVPCFYLYRT